MEKRFIYLALAALLIAMAVSCQKETLVVPESEPVSASKGDIHVNAVIYYVDGVPSNLEIYDDNGWNVFLDQVEKLVVEGHAVNFYIENSNLPLYAVAINTMSTTDPAVAKEWIMQKAKEGYQVEMAYSDGTFYCIAMRRE